MPMAIASRFATAAAAAGLSLALVASSAHAGDTGTPVPRPTDTPGPVIDQNPGDIVCGQRLQLTAEDLVQCIRSDALWAHMVAFQAIADANPGPDGHASRNIGEPGYLASALYVAEKMSAAGYSVQLQEYTVPYFNYKGLPHFEHVSPGASAYVLRTHYNPATYSGSGDVTALVQPAGGIVIPATQASSSGCSAASFTGFTPGRIALVQRGTCNNYTKVHNAELAGASGVIIFNDGGGGRTAAFRGSLAPYSPVGIPAVLTDYQTGANLYSQYNAAQLPIVRVDVQTIHDPYRADYNVIADSPLGDPDHAVVVEGHLDAIYGAGMLDSASGSVTMLEVGLKMRYTPTRNRLRYVWFGGEELGLYGSQYYVNNLSQAEVDKIVFDMDSDVTATPNYVFAIADPANSGSAGSWSPAMIQASQRGNDYFKEYFEARGIPYVVWSNDGTDSWSFSWRDVPNTGILTGQNCCKTQDLVNLFGGTLGNYEGNLGTSDGGFVDRPFFWGDNLDNNDPAVLATTSKAFAYVAWKLANDPQLAALAIAARTSAPTAPVKGARLPVKSGRRAVARAAQAAQARANALGPDR